MKINEAIILPLFESFGDLNRIIKSTHNTVFGMRAYTPNRLSDINTDSHEVADAIDNTYDELLHQVDQLSRNARNTTDLPSKRDVTTSDGLSNFLRYIIKHPVSQQDPRLKDVGWWIKKLRETRYPDMNFISVLDLMLSLSKDIVKFESDPNRKKPDMDVIKKTPKFEVYRLNNYAAARKVCTTFNTNFCTGSNAAMYDMYGKESNRDTYAISLPNKTVVMVHYRKGEGFLVTSHDNNSDFSDNNLRGNRGRGMLGVLSNFTDAGLTVDDMEEAMAVIMTRREADEIATTADDIKRDGVTKDNIRNPFDNDPLGDFDDDELLNLFHNPRQ